MTALLCAAGSLHAKTVDVHSAVVPETVLVFSSASLPELVREPPLWLGGPDLLPAWDLFLTCRPLAHLPDTLLAFTPATGACLTLAEYASTVPITGIDFSLRDRRGPVRLDELLESAAVVSIAPIPNGPPAVCGCGTGGNTPPTVVLQSGSPQTVEAGTPIGQIVFTATDAENDALSGEFTFTVDGAPGDGLPFGLHHSCSFGPGTAHCPVIGAAPYLTGIYSIELTVSDGSLTDSATATLEVVEGETVYDSGFE